MVKANNYGLATAVLSIKMKYTQDRPRIKKNGSPVCYARLYFLVILKNIENLIIAY